MTSRFGEIIRDFADGTYRFRLAIGQLRELEDKRNAGAAQICLRMSLWQHFIDDPIETLRLALIGGGDLSPVEAKKLVDRYVMERPVEEYLGLAVECLSVALYRPELDAQKKSEPPSEKPEPIASTSERSGEMLQ